ncbi:MAG: pseudouridine synthase [Halanaerobiaceae bacterium]
MERLQKYMAHAGVASRRKSEEIIAEGRVEVNGRVVTEMGTKINPEKDEIKVDGKVINKEKVVYILLNKPEGFVTTVDDPQGRKTVLDLINDIPQRIYPVGRLDRDTSGLLLLTNDGELTYKLTHPSYEINKRYMVVVSGSVSKKDLNKLEQGIELDDGLTAPAQVKLINKNNKTTIFSLTIHEGRNRQIRRMCYKIGHEVKELTRVAIGFLTINNLKTGNYRHLSENEVRKLKNMVD